MATLSLALIVKNEEIHLDQCLKNAHIFADEIIVCDTGSTDKTIEIAESYGAKIIHYEWCNDFSAARNYALDHCKMDYICMIDADDYIDEVNALNIKNRMIGGDLEFDILYCAYHTKFTDDGITFGLVPRERIYKNDKSIRFIYEIHECIEPAPHHIIKESREINVYHKNKRCDIDNNFSSNIRNIKYLEEALKKEDNKKNPRFWWCMAREYRGMKQYDEAIEYYKKTIEVWGDVKASKSWVKMIFELSIIYRTIRDMQNHIKYMNMVIDSAPNIKEGYFYKGLYYYEMNYFNIAIDYLEKCINIDTPNMFDVIRNDIYDDAYSYFYLAVIYSQLKDIQQAQYYIKKAYSKRSNDASIKKVYEILVKDVK